MILPASACTVTAACVAMLMMMTLWEGEATPTAGGHHQQPTRTHRKSSDVAAAVARVPLHLDPTVLAPPSHFRPLENTSISPWTYNVSHDASLFPPVVSEARCLLRGCLDAAGVEDLSLESRPVLHQVLLLRRVKSDGAAHSYHYRLESRLLAVGCTCVRPDVRQQV